jgi:hypothetical protein
MGSDHVWGEDTIRSAGLASVDPPAGMRRLPSRRTKATEPATGNHDPAPSVARRFAASRSFEPQFCVASDAWIG